MYVNPHMFYMSCMCCIFDDTVVFGWSTYILLSTKLLHGVISGYDIR